MNNPIFKSTKLVLRVTDDELQQFKKLQLEYDQAYDNLSMHESNFQSFINQLERKYHNLNETPIYHTNLDDVINEYRNQFIN
jgi:hypothetical protein